MGLWLHFVNVLLIHNVYLQFKYQIIDVSVFLLIKMALALVINLHLAGINSGVVFPYLVSPLFFSRWKAYLSLLEFVFFIVSSCFTVYNHEKENFMGKYLSCENCILKWNKMTSSWLVASWNVSSAVNHWGGDGVVIGRLVFMFNSCQRQWWTWWHINIKVWGIVYCLLEYTDKHTDKVISRYLWRIMLSDPDEVSIPSTMNREWQEISRDKQRLSTRLPRDYASQ